MNNKYYKSLVTAAIITSLSQTATANDLTAISAVQDTWTNDTGAGSGANYGTQTTLRIDTNKMRAFIQFNVTDIPENHSVESAILTLTAQGNKSGNIPDVFIAPVDSAPDWDQSTLTDLTDDDLIAATKDSIASATDIAVGSSVDLDLATTIGANGIYTFMINMTDADARATKFYSSEASAAFRPVLNIKTVANIVSDSTPPVFPDNIAPFNVDATGRTTDISSFISIKATDDTDGEIQATFVSEPRLTSGIHTITLQATDAANNKATKDITVNITPQVVLTAPESLSLPPGTTVSASVELSGPAASYPVTIDYTITGEATDDTHATLTFTEQNYADAQQIDIALKDVAKNAQSAVLTLTDTTNVQASNDTVTLSVVDTNLPPSLSLILSQNETTIATISASNANNMPYIDGTKGPVLVTLDINDFNNGDTHTATWSDGSTALGADSQSFELSIAELSGDITLSVSASENNTNEKFTAELSTKLRIVPSALPPLIPDADSDNDGILDTQEGFNDADNDGIVDYLDNNADTTQLPLAAEQVPLQTTPDLTLSLGSITTAQGIEARSANITIDDLTNHVASDSANTIDTAFLPLAGTSLFNFALNGVTAGGKGTVVYALPNDVVISEDTALRKYTPIAGWTTFVSDGDNRIASAAKNEAGDCPAPLSEHYIDGLTAGDSCVELTIKDGGVYDADGLENGTIEDPGLFAESITVLQWNSNVIELPATSINENDSLSMTRDLTTYLVDADIDNLSFTVDSDASWLSIDQAGILTADLSTLGDGDHTANVIASDNKFQTATISVSVAVAFNYAPTLAEFELPNATLNQEYVGNIASAISDLDSDSYTIKKTAGPYWLKINEIGQLSGTPYTANIGTNTIKFSITDDKGAVTLASFDVSVVDDNSTSSAGAFSIGAMTLLGLLGLRRKKTNK
ncbi:DNRLRE domain-containing protein [Psychrobium sp. nBUS_13]|uniref:DNRLRE domain-containing protein n=1 Tax=Psychrobium sp. nBUS_13 TaxID=3395319 RepID=UPI003EBC8527